MRATAPAMPVPRMGPTSPAWASPHTHPQHTLSENMCFVGISGGLPLNTKSQRACYPQRLRTADSNRAPQNTLSGKMWGGGAGALKTRLPCLWACTWPYRGKAPRVQVKKSEIEYAH